MGMSRSYPVTKNTRKLGSCVLHDTEVYTFQLMMSQGLMLPEFAHNTTYISKQKLTYKLLI